MSQSARSRDNAVDAVSGTGIPRVLLARRPGLKDLLAEFLGGRLDILHDLSDACSGGLVAPLGLGNVISG